VREREARALLNVHHREIVEFQAWKQWWRAHGEIAVLLMLCETAHTIELPVELPAILRLQCDAELC